MTGPRWLVAICAVLPFILAGCAADRVSGVQVRKGAVQGVHANTACVLAVDAIDDQRDSKTLGQIGRTRVDGEAFADWFAQGIASRPESNRDSPVQRLRIVILKAYVHGLSTLKSANLIVRVEFLSDGKSSTSKTYRGVDDSMNWSSSQDEIQAAFDRALTDLVGQIHADAAKRCRAATSPAASLPVPS
ncbi:hypothetical protein [Variovorax fucosicus]|uniref:hypothetical protein n=1 Tax=Variovorax fucosicus TaxID=3053517 RepID=UPI002574AB32|nr:hypothetical protein [Variovorax sp. J22G47]MDM0058205.1 hypothetical protein [Variovorax sp. J22G47]